MSDWLRPALDGIDQEISSHQARIRELEDIRSKLAGDQGDQQASHEPQPVRRQDRRRPEAMASRSPGLSRKTGGAQAGRQMSAEARKRLSDAMKRRWASRKRQGATSLSD